MRCSRYSSTRTTASACSITGGVVVRDPALGRTFGAGTSTATSAPVRSAPRSLGLPLATDDGDTGLDVSLLVSFGEDAGGCVYAVSIAGTVYRIARRRGRRPCPARTFRPRRHDLGACLPAPAAVTFAFTSSEAGSTFECRFDAGPWNACSSPAGTPPPPDRTRSGCARPTPAEPSIRRRRQTSVTTIMAGGGGAAPSPRPRRSDTTNDRAWSYPNLNPAPEGSHEDRHPQGRHLERDDA